MKTTYTQEEVEAMVNGLNAKRIEVIRELQLQNDEFGKQLSIQLGQIQNLELRGAELLSALRVLWQHYEDNCHYDTNNWCRSHRSQKPCLMDAIRSTVAKFEGTPSQKLEVPQQIDGSPKQCICGHGYHSSCEVHGWEVDKRKGVDDRCDCGHAIGDHAWELGCAITSCGCKRTRAELGA